MRGGRGEGVDKYFHLNAFVSVETTPQVRPQPCFMSLHPKTYPDTLLIVQVYHRPPHEGLPHKYILDSSREHGSA